ncbi:holo-ACP synthase [Pelomicrobium sp. G1]|uniref:holo-ACP synthase n=1 Tax=unclassified Pelomicrobium TaxID=2815318 RepID=UPI003F760F3B
MIYGIGTDIVDTRRIERLLERYGERFARRLLTSLEWERFQGSRRPAAYLALRFAAKEAFSKAMGTGFRTPVLLSHISVVQDRLGKPRLVFHGALEAYMRERGIASHHLTLSDEAPFACAVVVLER